MSSSEIKLAIIMDATVVLLDGNILLTFSTFISECISTTQYVPIKSVKEIFDKYNIHNIHELNGKPCWVESALENGCQTIKYLRPCRIRD